MDPLFFGLWLHYMTFCAIMQDRKSKKQDKLCGENMRLIHQGSHELKLKLRDNLDYPLHLQHALEIILVEKGSTRVQYEGEFYPLRAGDLFVIFPDRIHGFYDSVDISGMVMIVPVEPYLGELRGILEHQFPSKVQFSRDEWCHTGLDQLFALAFQDWEKGTDLRQRYSALIVAKLIAFLPLQEEKEGGRDAIGVILRYLHEHYRENLTRQELSRAVGYHESYISHLFYRTLKLTLTQYIASLRIHDAMRLLKGTNQSISEIAFSLGFGSIRSLNRTFHAQTGMSPSQYRKKKDPQ